MMKYKKLVVLHYKKWVIDVLKLGIEQNVLKLRKQTGISHYLINIINNFKGIDITLYTQYNRHGENKNIVPLDIKYKLDEIHISKRQTLNLLYFYSLGQYKILKDIDVFWGQHFTQPLYYPKKVKLVSTIYDLIPFHINNEAQNKIYNTLGKYLIKKTIKNSDVIVTISETIKKEIVDMFQINPYKIKIIYPQVNHLKVYDKDEKETKKELLKQRFNLLPKQYFLSVYSVRPRKNLITLLKQYNNLNKDIIKKHPLVIVGYIDTKYYNEVYQQLLNEQKKQEEKGGKVIFTNYITDKELELLYNFSYIFISPTSSEGFDMPQVEQLLHDNIVIQSNIPVHKEILGKLVYYYEIFNYIQLRNIIEGIIIYGKSKNIHNITSLYYFYNYTWKDQQNEYMKIFKNLVKM